MRCTLHQFNFSHFNEKARWALDWKNVPHDRVDMLPGPHAGAARKLSGQTATPILVLDDEAIAGSAAIVEAVDAGFPGASLFPADPLLRAEAERWIDWLDEEVGPAVRLSLFHVLLPESRYAARIFGGGQPAWKGAPYRLVFPALVPRLLKMMGIDDDSASEAAETIAKALDRVADGVRERGYLVGDRFTAADLTAASLLMPLCFPAEGPVDLVALPPPPTLARWLARWEGHEAIAWTRRMYATHRATRIGNG